MTDEPTSGAEAVRHWEMFCDTSYFDLWAIRPVGVTTFGAAFHVQSHKEAEGLCATLNRLECRAALATPAASPADALDAVMRDALAGGTGFAIMRVDPADVASPSPAPAAVERCLVTGNPVGTDTWPAGKPCACPNCSPAPTEDDYRNARFAAATMGSTIVGSAPSPAPAAVEPCQWGGGNDYSRCLTCGVEYDYRREDKPACPNAPATVEELVARLVKPLEWNNVSPASWHAVCPISRKGYFIGPEEGKWWACWNCDLPGFDTPEEAKAAAQADYTSRTLSALDATALSTLAADKAKAEAERDAALHQADANIIGAVNDEIGLLRTAKEAAEARASALEGEVERLKGAVQEIAGQESVSELCAEFGEDYEGDWQDGYDHCVAIARAAIRKETP